MTRKKREQYEALIESIMIGEIAATRNNPELNNILQSKVSVEKKRMAITSVLDENVKVFNKIRRFVENNNVSRSEFVRYLVEQLKYYVKDGEIEQKKYGEVMTPFSLVNDMLDTLPKEVWNNPDLKWFDPANGVGIFPVIIVERLMKGLEEIIPDEDERYRHIMEEMIYVSELQPRNAFLFLVGFDPLNEFDLNIYLGDSLGDGFVDMMKNNWNIVTFDIIVGNPPYQIMDGGHGSSAKPIYNLFIEKVKSFNPKYITMITPSRWFAGGKGLNTFRDIMLNDKRIRYIKDYVNAKECFPTISIGGGVSFFLWDNEYNGKCTIVNSLNDNTDIGSRYLNEFSIFVRNNKAVKIIRKVNKNIENDLSDIITSRNPFGISSSRRGEIDSFENSLNLHSSKGIGFVIESEVIKNKDLVNTYKVMISKVTSEHAGEPDKNGMFRILSRTVILKPNDICTDSYLILGGFNNENQAVHLFNYLSTKFVRFLLSQATTSINLSKDKFMFVPIQNFNENWTDEKLYKMYNLNDDEINYIESIIKPIIIH